ncbi:WD40-repeat-containing domain protein [Yarrowia lipolytica]|uniref:YALI0D11132p n=2 Tax=Yarrowia lipolytica TaxID=4952 RepID=Q6C9H6_YARLI|nr:YALI0D11132p [Yarrowia lipolytica CLIB122]AOW03911.1 hypothetical protein YALI1_D14004g [Yarrowia lipolytica]KAB8283034.1 WD40-repeat-containing domain protein [Yarrowia lipolytica]KAE8172404.1 WD40-repeat-containing domain protein [Yarrowia lipolytica]KAJ8054521.1 WD40-repeat-containing domain protein [Yarrowia lipolytica]RDW39087.1 WD40-repeat-containing domain protein [Yarrowia lipolytica]|eukprot:XP_502686.1 YALI0D11132p [Yarrowia lipolytica CLIB122]
MAPTYKISKTLIGHEQDVKGVCFVDSEVVSCSRDTSVRKWHSDRSSDAIYNGGGFMNAIAAAPNGRLIAAGGQDKMIALIGDDTARFLVGHEGNVCALDLADDLVISGSWDKTAKVWNDGHVLYNLEGHAQAVWAVKIVSAKENVFMTASADKTIKLWHHAQCVATLPAHTDAVRGLAILGDGKFVSVSNDTTVKLWQLSSDNKSAKEIKTLDGHTSFVYSVAAISPTEFITTGEDRTARIWNATTGETTQVITLPCVSVWSGATASNGDIAVGGSDAKVRVFSRDSSRFADVVEIEDFEASVANSAIGKDQVGEINKDKLPGPERLSQPGTKEGEVIMVKGNGIVEAHQWSAASSSWTKIGEVVDAPGAERKKVAEDGKEYDYIFDVDVEEGQPALKLPYNSNENVYAAAQRFIDRYELPQGYLEEIVQFIIKNTGGVNIGGDSGPAPDPYGGRYVPGGEVSGPTPSVSASAAAAAPSIEPAPFPLTTPLFINTYNAAALSKGLDKFNSSEAAPLADDELSALKLALSKNELGSSLLSVVLKIVSSWSEPLLGLDILRLMAEKLGAPKPEIVTAVEGAVASPKLAHKLMGVRFVVNSVAAKNTFPDVESVIDTVKGTLADYKSEKLFGQYETAVATLLLDLAVNAYDGGNVEAAFGLLQSISEVWEKVTGNEAVFRLAVAAGTLFSLKSEEVASCYDLFNYASLVARPYDELRLKKVMVNLTK